MRERYLQLDTHDLEIVLSFFDCDRLRHHYTALIAEMRAERDRRWALDSNALDPELEAWAQRQRQLEGSK